MDGAGHGGGAVTATADGPVEMIAEDPPPSTRSRPTGIGSWLHEMRDRPGVWHRHPDPQTNAAIGAQIKGGRYKGTAAGEYDAVVRTVVLDGEKRFHLYARYLGGES